MPFLRMPFWKGKTNIQLLQEQSTKLTATANETTQQGGSSPLPVNTNKNQACTSIFKTDKDSNKKHSTSSGLQITRIQSEEQATEHQSGAPNMTANSGDQLEDTYDFQKRTPSLHQDLSDMLTNTLVVPNKHNSDSATSQAQVDLAAASSWKPPDAQDSNLHTCLTDVSNTVTTNSTITASSCVIEQPLVRPKATKASKSPNRILRTPAFMKQILSSKKTSKKVKNKNQMQQSTQIEETKCSSTLHETHKSEHTSLFQERLLRVRKRTKNQTQINEGNSDVTLLREHTMNKEATALKTDEQSSMPWFDNEETFEHMCAICYDILVRPHAVQPCNHVFCEMCLLQLQTTTAGRTARPNRYGVLVLCPVCRHGIDRCDFKKDLDAKIQATYPQVYKTREKVLAAVQKTNKQLPTSKGVTEYPRRGAGLLHRPWRARFLAPGPRIERLLVATWRFRPFLEGWWRIVTSSGRVCICIVAVSVCFMVLATCMTTIGVCKVAVTLTGHNGAELTPEPQGRPGLIHIKKIRWLSFGVFLLWIVAFMTLSWGGFISGTLLVLVVAVVGFVADKNICNNIWNALRMIFS